MQIASLFARIGLKTDEEKAKSFTRSMRNARTTLIGVAAVVTATSAAIAKVTSDALDAAAAFRQFEVETGASAQELQRWQAVAEQTNSSAEAVSQAIRAITSNQEQIRLGRGDISGFQLLGIDPRQDPFQILEQLRTRTEGLSQGMKRNILAQMGIGAGLLHTLELSREEFDALAGRAFIISPQAIDTLAQARASMNQARRGVEFLKAQIAVGLAPQMQRLTAQFIEFIKRNEEGFIRGFQRAFTIIQRVGLAISRAGRFVDDLVRATFGWENAIKVVIGALAVLNASLLFSPIGIITAGIILLIALFEDLAVYSRGGQSLFGVFIEQFPALGETILGVVDGIRTAIEVVRSVIQDGLSIDEAVEQWGVFGGVVAGVVEWFQILIDNYLVRVKNELQAINDLLSGEGWTRFAEQLGPLAGGIAGAVTAEDNRGRAFLEGAQRGLENAPLLRLLDPLGATRALGEVITNTFNITINESDDPRTTAEEVMDLQQRAQNATSAQRGRNE